ncbi:MAG: zinc ABC transporter substrate-binding protein, partial [Armatimonadetes bacterium]|nr:zinc ABC transporter substrate-binding protein [Armatimonadota bacterium]
AEAKVVLRVGPGLDDWLESLLANSRAQTLTCLDLTPPIMATAHEHHQDEGHAHHEGDAHARGEQVADPHVWLDPIRMRDDLAPAIAAALAAIDPGQQPAVDVRLKAFQERLTALDAELRGHLGTLANRKYIAAHAAWAYFNARYQLEQVAVIEPQPGQEPSAQWLKQVVDAARRSGAGAVFGEVQLNQSLGRIIEREAKLRFGLLDPQGGVPGRDTYEALLRYNARQFAEVLGHG